MNSPLLASICSINSFCVFLSSDIVSFIPSISFWWFSLHSESLSSCYLLQSVSSWLCYCWFSSIFWFNAMIVSLESSFAYYKKEAFFTSNCFSLVIPDILLSNLAILSFSESTSFSFSSCFYFYSSCFSVKSFIDLV